MALNGKKGRNKAENGRKKGVNAKNEKVGVGMDIAKNGTGN